MRKVKGWRHILVSQLGVALLVFSLSLWTYLRTLLPGVGDLGDTAKFQFIAQVWGIPHPTGYPLYILLSRAFSMLPVGSIAYRINLMSAFFAASTVAILSLIIWHLTDDPIASLGGSLLFAFSPTFWSQALIAEVYTLNAFILSLVMFSLLLWRRKGKVCYLYLSVFIYGLGLGNHMTLLLFSPAFFLFILLTDRKVLFERGFILLCAAVALLSASLYLYFLFRARGEPIYAEAFPTTAGQLLRFVTGREFHRDFLVFAPRELLSRLSMYNQNILENFSAVGYLCGWLGLGLLWPLRKRAVLSLFLLPFLGNLAFALNFSACDITVFFIPTYLIFALWIGVFLGFVKRSLSSSGGLVALGSSLAISLVILLLPLSSLRGNICDLDESENHLAEESARRFLESMEEKATVVLSAASYDRLEALLYMNLVERVGPEFLLIDAAEIDDHFGENPVYCDWRSPAIVEHYILRPLHDVPLAFSQLVASIPQGKIVVLAAKDEASSALTEEAVKAIRSLGGEVDLRGGWRWAHALIGVKGAKPGTALEGSGRGPVTLRVGKGELIGETRVRSPAQIFVRSAGYDNGNWGDIRVNCNNISKEGRGYNIVVIDPRSGRVGWSVNVDTHASLIGGVEQYKIVARKEGERIVLADEEEANYWEPEGEVIEFASLASRKHLLFGWSDTESWGTWAIGDHSILLVHLEPGRDYTMELVLWPYPVEGLRQMMAVYYNDTPLGKLSFDSQERQLFKVDIPAVLITEGVDSIKLVYGYNKRNVESIDESDGDLRPLAVAFESIRFIDHR